MLTFPIKKCKVRPKSGLANLKPTISSRKQTSQMIWDEPAGVNLLEHGNNDYDHANDDYHRDYDHGYEKQPMTLMITPMTR